MTMNESWGYVPDDEDWKSARDLVHALCETVARGGNLLLNVGPRGDGSLEPDQAPVEAVAGWMDRRLGVHDASPDSSHGSGTARRPGRDDRFLLSASCAPTTRSPCAASPSTGSSGPSTWRPAGSWRSPPAARSSTSSSTATPTARSASRSPRTSWTTRPPCWPWTSAPPEPAPVRGCNEGKHRRS